MVCGAYMLVYTSQVGSYCCQQYQEFCEMLVHHWSSKADTRTARSTIDLIDIGPSSHYGSKEARKAAKKRLLEKYNTRVHSFDVPFFFDVLLFFFLSEQHDLLHQCIFLEQLVLSNFLFACMERY